MQHPQPQPQPYPHDTPLMAALDAMSNAFLVPLVAAGAALVLGILIPG